MRTTLIPRPKAGRARWNMSILARPSLTALSMDDRYAVSSVLGDYMYLNGGWPRVIALNGPGEVPFAERLSAQVQFEIMRHGQFPEQGHTECHRRQPSETSASWATGPSLPGTLLPDDVDSLNHRGGVPRWDGTGYLLCASSL